MSVAEPQRAVKFQCNVCLREYPPEQLYRPEGYLATPILCDTCGVGVTRYWAMQDELYRAQVLVLRDLQTDLLIQLKKSETLIKMAEREQRLKERRAAKLTKQPQDDSELIAEVDKEFGITTAIRNEDTNAAR